MFIIVKDLRIEARQTIKSLAMYYDAQPLIDPAISVVSETDLEGSVRSEPDEIDGLEVFGYMSGLLEK